MTLYTERLTKKMGTLAAEMERAQAMVKWRGRLDNILEATGQTASAFCQQNGIDHTYLLHHIAGRRGITPELFAKVEDIFERAEKANGLSTEKTKI